MEPRAVRRRSIAWLDLFVLFDRDTHLLHELLQTLGALLENLAGEPRDIKVNGSAAEKNEFVIRAAFVPNQRMLFRHATTKVFPQVVPFPIDAVLVSSFNENRSFKA